MEIEYTSDNPESSLMLMAAFNEILWWKQMKKLMPMVAKELMKAGVKFPKP